MYNGGSLAQIMCTRCAIIHKCIACESLESQERRHRLAGTWEQCAPFKVNLESAIKSPEIYIEILESYTE